VQGPRHRARPWVKVRGQFRIHCDLCGHQLGNRAIFFGGFVASSKLLLRGIWDHAFYTRVELFGT